MSPFTSALCHAGLIISLATSANVLAGQCPTTLTQNQKGLWSSAEKPGWASVKPTESNITVTQDNFNGAAYNPKQKKMICVYKYKGTNKMIWVVLLSNKKHFFHEDDLINFSSWEYNHRYKLFVCGDSKEKATIKGCQFTIN